MIGWGAAVASIFKFLTGVTDADKKTTSYKLRKLKNIHKCMDAAEHIIFATDSFFNKNISAKTLKFIFKKNRKIFFDNN